MRRDATRLSARRYGRFGCLAAFILALVGPALCVVATLAPSDQQMISMLTREASSFRRLIEMCYEDQNASRHNATVRTYVYSTGAWQPEYQFIDDDRRSEYRRLLRKVGGGYRLSCTDDQVEFSIYAHGLSISGSTKGYVYRLSDDDARLFPSLDYGVDIWEGQSGVAVAYRRVDDDWHLVYVGS